MRNTEYFLDWTYASAIAVDPIVQDQHDLEEKDYNEYAPLSSAERKCLISFVKKCTYWIRTDGFFIFCISYDFDEKKAPKRFPSERDLAELVSQIIKSKYTSTGLHGFLPTVRICRIPVKLPLKDSDIGMAEQIFKEQILCRIKEIMGNIEHFDYNTLGRFEYLKGKSEEDRAYEALKSDSILYFLPEKDFNNDNSKVRLAVLRLRQRCARIGENFFKFRQSFLENDLILLIPMLAFCSILMALTAPILMHMHRNTLDSNMLEHILPIILFFGF